MPSHQERIRAKNPEMNCEHFWIYSGGSDIAPFIELDGTRTTLSVCLNCLLEHRYTRTQNEFLLELHQKFANSLGLFTT